MRFFFNSGLSYKYSAAQLTTMILSRISGDKWMSALKSENGEKIQWDGQEGNKSLEKRNMTI